MTFNVRFATVVDETPRWSARRPVMRELLRRERPHVIGTQEGLYQQLRMIERDLGGHYDWIGTGRGGGSKDEFMAIFYDTRRLDPIEFDHFWLSDTPYAIASNTWDADWLRMVTWVKFADLADGGREFYVLNTHLDSVSQYARERSARLIGETIAGWDRSSPVIVTGDFNAAAHDNRVYDLMLDSGLVDAWDAAASRSPAYGTYHGYRALKPDGQAHRLDPHLARGYHALGGDEHLLRRRAAPERPSAGAGLGDPGMSRGPRDRSCGRGGLGRLGRSQEVQPLRVLISSVSCGTTSKRSPTTP